MNTSSPAISRNLNVAAFHEAAEQPGTKTCKWRKQLVRVPGPNSPSPPFVQQTSLTVLPLCSPATGLPEQPCQPGEPQASYTQTGFSLTGQTADRSAGTEPSSVRRPPHPARHYEK